MFEWIASPEAWIALGTLTALEIVLGIDNIIFISILVARLPESQRDFARKIGLTLAMVARLALLFCISWVMGLTDNWLHILGQEISGRDIILILGGLFLVGKSTHEIHASLEGEEGHHGSTQKATLGMVLIQIAILDLVFSLDSVITAVGLADQVSIMVIAIVVAVSVMMIWVVPKITRVFVSAKAELPTVTKVVVTLSDFTQAYGGFILLAFVVVIVGFQIFVSNVDRRRIWHKQLLKFPGLGNWMRMANLADWSRSLSTLLESGVPALAALKISSSVMTNLHMQSQMEEVTERMRRGSSLQQSLKDENAGTGFLLHMVGSGEASSELDAMLMRVSEYYSARLKSSVETFLKLMNPALIISMGFVILIIVAAVMLPILKMNEMV